METLGHPIRITKHETIPYAQLDMQPPHMIAEVRRRRCVCQLECEIMWEMGQYLHRKTTHPISDM